MATKPDNSARTQVIVATLSMAGVLGAAYIATKIRSDPPATIVSSVSVPQTISKGGGKAVLTPNVEVALEDVETLKGKTKLGESVAADRDGSEFNKKLNDREHVFRVIMSKVGVNQNVDSFFEMSTANWDEFLDKLEPDKRERIKEIPFAQFAVYVNGQKDEGLYKKYFFADEEVAVPVNSQNVRFDVVKVINTKKGSHSPESVIIRLK